MKKSILEIYALAICFVVVIAFTISLGIGLFNIVQILNPTLTMNNWDWERFSNNDTFYNNNPHLFYDKGSEIQDKSKFTEDEITTMRENSLVIAIENEKRSAMQSLIRVIIFLLITSTVYFLHWRLAIRARE